MSKPWDSLEEVGRLLCTSIQRHILNDVDACRLASLLQRASHLLSHSYRGFGHNNVYLSFNGGKDSVAVFHLYRLAVLVSTKGRIKEPAVQPNVVYFKDPRLREFKEVREFMERTAITYNFTLRVIEDNWFNGIPKLSPGANKAFILGVRSSDVDNERLSELQEGRIGNATFTRIHPILDWNYGDVWNFLRLFSLEYCAMYDHGYTSIGSIDDTIANPHLRNPDGSHSPAYTLQDWRLERFGRSKL